MASLIQTTAQLEAIYILDQEGTIYVRRDFLLKPFDSQENLANPSKNDWIRTLKDQCKGQSIKDKSDTGLFQSTGGRAVCFVKINEMFYIATLQGVNSLIGGEVLWPIQFLRDIAEIIDETIGIDKMKDHFHSIIMALDQLIDHGYPLLPVRPIFHTLLQQPQSQTLALISTKVANMAGSINEKHSQIMQNAIQSKQGKPWRWSEKIQQVTDAETLTASIVKDVYVDFNEYVTGIMDYGLLQVAGEIKVETRLPFTSNPRIQIKTRLPRSGVKDLVLHPQCESKKDSLTEEIGGHEFCIPIFTPPQSGSMTVLRYLEKDGDKLSLPFELKAKISDCQNSQCQFEVKFERLKLGKGELPVLQNIQIQLYFPFDTTNIVGVTSLPDGTFSYDQSTQIGEWSITQISQQLTDTIHKLNGTIKLPSDGPNQNISLFGSVSLKIPQYSFSGAIVEKVLCNLDGNGNRDDPTVFKGVKQTAFVKNLEFRL